MGCSCGKPKCDGHCGVSPAVLQINNPSECVLFRKVEVPASMGTSVENPPKPGAYRNVLLYYNADGEAYLYSSDGIPTKVTGTTSNYEILTNKPKINGVELVGDKSLADIGVTDAIDNALENYTPTSEFAEVAFTGDYEDLINTPPKVVTHFYTLSLSQYDVGDEVPIYNDEGMTDQTTYEQFVDAVMKGPVQFNQQYDVGAYNISGIYLIAADIEYDIGFSVEDTPGGNQRTEMLWNKSDSMPVIEYIRPEYTQVNADWNVTNTSSPAYIKNKPTLAAVATSGNYNDLSNKPTIPAAQVNSDWNAVSGVAQILNKPSLATVATSGSYNDLTDKPTIPTVNNATLTIQKNGTNVQTFTANQSTNATANITVPTKTSDLTNDGATGTSVYVEESDIAPSELSGEGEFVTLEGTTDCSTLDTQLLGNAEQTGTPTPDSPQPISTVTGEQTVKITGKNLQPTTWAQDFVDAVNNSSIASIETFDSKNCLEYTPSAGYGDYPHKNFTLGVNFRESTQYTISFDEYSTASNRHAAFYYTDGTYSTYTATSANTWTRATMTSTAGKTVAYVAPYYTSGTTYIDIGTIQLELGSTATAYEPYQGQSYEVDLSLASKNMLNPAWMTAGFISVNGDITPNQSQGESACQYFIPVEPNTEYTFEIFATSDAYPTWIGIGEYSTASESGFTTRVTNTSDNYLTFTTASNAHFIRPSARNLQHATKYMLSKGSRTTYEPYFELAKVGDYQDRIYKDDGKWYIEKQIGKVVFDGTETWASSGGTVYYTSALASSVADTPATAQTLGLSNYFEVVGFNYKTDTNLYFHPNKNLQVSATNWGSLSAWTTWLSTHPTTVYYALATPTTTEITDEALIGQLEALAGALGYDGVTNIMSASPELPAILSVSTYTDSAIPPATRVRAGIVRIGDGIDVDDCGTISVNAQKAPTAFTMQYADNLAGWQSGDNYELVKETTGSPTDYIYRANKFYYGGADVSFLNEKTGVVFTPQELYAWLIDGNEAVINHVPLGWAVNNDAEVLDTGNYIDGIWLKRETIASQSGNVISFNGSAFVTAFISRAGGYERVQDTLGIAISGYEEDGAMVYDLISIDGFSLYGSVQESSPII